MDAPRSAPLARVLACTTAFVALDWVPVLGIDQLAASPLGADPFGRPALSVAPELTYLVLARALRSVLSREEERAARTRVIAAAFVGLAALAALAQATALEVYSDEAPIEIVSRPGLAFRIGFAVGRGAAAALAWQLAEWIRDTRVASGTLTLVAAAALLDWAARVWILAAQATTLQIGVLTTLALVAVIALVVLALVVRARPPVSWPVTVLGPMRVASPIDVVLTTIALALVLADRVLLGARATIESAAPLAYTAVSAVSISPMAAWGPAIDALGVAVAALVATLAWSRVPRGADDRHAGVSVVLASATIVLVAFPPLAWIATGGAALAMAPSAWSGGSTLDVTLVGDRPAAEHDAEVLRARAEALRIDADVAVLGPHRLHVVLRDAIGTEALDALLVPRRLVVALEIDEPEQDTLPDDVRWIPPSPLGPARLGGDEASLRAWADAHPAALGTTRVIDCATPRRCETHLVAEPTLTNRDVVDAAVSHEEDGRPDVAITLGARGADAFERLTAAHVHQTVAILVDGHLLMAPIVQSRIGGGHLRITLGSADDPEPEAEALASALAAGPLEADWSVAR